METAGTEIDLDIPNDLPEMRQRGHRRDDNCGIGGLGKSGVAVERAIGALVAGILQSMGIDTTEAGLPDKAAMRA